MPAAASGEPAAGERLHGEIGASRGAGRRARTREAPAAPTCRCRPISADLAELSRARHFVRAFCRGLPAGQLDAEEVAGLELATNEAASNIIKHGSRGRAGGPIDLEAVAFPTRVLIRLGYAGDRFDPSTAAPPALDGSRESGFGLYLIERSVDAVRYSRDERGRNGIHLVKVLHPESERLLPCTS